MTPKKLAEIWCAEAVLAAKFGEVKTVINQHALVFTVEGEPIFRLSGEGIGGSFALMAHTRVIASLLRVLQLEVNPARREVAAFISNCATYQEASEILKDKPQLCA